MAIINLSAEKQWLLNNVKTWASNQSCVVLICDSNEVSITFKFINSQDLDPQENNFITMEQWRVYQDQIKGAGNARNNKIIAANNKGNS